MQDARLGINDDDLHPCSQPWTGWRSQLRGRTLRPSCRSFMPIRITHRDKNRISMQHADMVKLTTGEIHVLRASYTDGRRVMGMLCVYI
jgi:hypothetical protein